MSQSPLLSSLKQVLDANPAGLVERDIRRHLIEDLSVRSTPPEIRNALIANPKLFVPFANNLWRLKSIIESEEFVAAFDPTELRDQTVQTVIPFLSILPNLDTFIAFDLETTGTKSHDQILQISAVRISQGEPSARVTPAQTYPPVFSFYVHAPSLNIPHSLKIKLGFVDHPEWERAIAEADPLAQVLPRFLEWAGDAPLVAHNARFDYNLFLKPNAEKLGYAVPNPIVDSMELAILALPQRNSFRLEELAAELGIANGQPAGQAVEAWAHAQGIPEFSWTSFHNATIDVLVLAAVVPRLVAAIRERVRAHPALAGEFYRLLPETAAQLNLPSPAAAREPDAAILSLVNLPPSITRMPPSQASYTPTAIRYDFAERIAQHGLKQRESQLRMVEAVAHSLAENRFMLVEAPTGTGKTFAYLFPGVQWARTQGEPVAISTHTRLLQDQMSQDLDKVKSLGLDFQSQVLKGMSNYGCLERIAAQYAQIDISHLTVEERFAWLYLLFWLSVTQNGLLEELSYWATNTFPALSRLAASLKSDRSECSQDRCAACGVCFHRFAYARAQQSDIVVMNHALLLSKDWDENTIPFRRVVIDEAHTLEDAATDAATIEVSWDTIMYLVNRLLDRRSGQGALIRIRTKVSAGDGQALIAVALRKRDALANLTVDFGEQLKRYIEFNKTKIDPRYTAKLTLEADPRRANPTSWLPAETAREQLSNALLETAGIIANLHAWLSSHPLPAFQAETINELSYLITRLHEQSDLLTDLLRVGYDRLSRVHWLEVERARPLDDLEEIENYTGPYKWAVKQAPVRIGPYLQEKLYADKQTLVLTSATLRTTRESAFGFFLNRLGLESLVSPEDAISLPPELDYSRALFGIARYMPYDGRPTETKVFTQAVGEELKTFFEFTGGNGLTLFTARERMLQVYRDIEPFLGGIGIPVGAQGETGSRKALLEELKTRPGSVLLGLRSFWEGVDVAGPNLSYVLMEKLPFPLLFEPVIAARAAEIRERKGHEFTDYILPLMLISFKQGFGRLIRDERDLGAVLLLDKRVWNRDYRGDLESSLPGMDSDAANVNKPIILDADTQLSRKAVYQKIYEHMQAAPPEWKIDFERLKQVLETISDTLLTQFDHLLRELQVPDIIPLDRVLEFGEKIKRGLKTLFGFDNFRDPQQRIVDAILTGNDVLVILPTGSGKSLTFQLPALLRSGTTIVFSPLKALMKDQVDKFIDKGLPVADRIDSSQNAEEQERVYIRMREGTTRLVYIAPERVRDPKLMAALRSAHNIVQVVVDEAHCVHMWGQSFRPDFLYIANLVDSIAQTRGRRPPVAALTATATPHIRESIAQRLQLRSGFETIATNPNRPELRFVVYNATNTNFPIRSRRDKFRALLRILRIADRNDESAIVYVNTTMEAERLATRLESMGLDVRYYHGKMDDQARKDVQDVFLEGQVKIIVATKAFGMGIDKSDIRYVIHHQMPADIESYYQEAGRAGRDGQVSWAILLYHDSDVWIHENFFIPKSLPDPDVVENVLDWLRRRCEAANWSESYINPQEMADALDFEEDRELGIHLHLLEQLGYIHRGLDVTLQASARLLSPLQTVVEHARRIDANLAGTVERVLINQGITSIARGELRMVDAALQESISPLDLDNVFYQLALQGHMIYRSFGRAFTIMPGTAMIDGTPLNLNVGELQRIQAEMTRNLAAIRRYAESLGAGDCLREYILQYLGDAKPATRRDQCCSLCDPNLSVPWANEPMWDDLSDPGRYNDAKFSILKGVAWNSDLANERGRAPYGAWTLTHILLGNDYMATKFESHPARRAAKRQSIVTSPYFGTLEGLQGGPERLQELLGDLRVQGYIQDQTREWENGKYNYPSPTILGAQRLQEGQLFNESGQAQ